MSKYEKICVLILLIVIILSGNNKSYVLERNNYSGQRITRSSEYLMARANQDWISNYEDGHKSEMYTFKHVNDDQSELYDYRYIGKKANNYIYFNCMDTSNVSTCELWRIIGAFKVENNYKQNEYRLKIIRDEPIDNMAWNSSGISNWNNASIMKYLNKGDYWYSIRGKSQNAIDVAKFYIGGINASNLNGSDLYQLEHSNNSYNNYPYDYYGNVGLISPSDYSYMFGYGVSDECYNNIYNCSNREESWFRLDAAIWTMIPSSVSNNAYTVGDNSSSHNVSESYSIYPVVYLKYDTVIESGNGTPDDAYMIRTLSRSDIQSEQEMLKNGDAGDKSNVNVDDTSSFLPTILLIISGIIITIGLCVLVINFIKSRNEKKKIG